MFLVLPFVEAVSNVVLMMSEEIVVGRKSLVVDGVVVLRDVLVVVVLRGVLVVIVLCGVLVVIVLCGVLVVVLLRVVL